LGLKPCAKPINDFCLMLRARKHSNSTTMDRNHGVAWIVRCKMATRAVDPACWPVVQQVCRALGGQSTDRGELLTMLITTDQRDRELVYEQKRYRPSFN
jgi:hypothetical protein